MMEAELVEKVVDRGPSPMAEGIRTTRLLERAMREGWPMTEEMRSACVHRQIKVAIDPKSSNRDSRAAFQSVLIAHGQNIALLQHADKKEGVEQHLHIHANGETGLDPKTLGIHQLASILASLGPPEEAGEVIDQVSPAVVPG